MFKVNELLNATNGRLIQGNIDTVIKGISIDSRTIKPQEAFIAIKGSNFDGSDFINEAIKKGASCVIQKSPSRQVDKSPRVAFIEVRDTQKALGDIAGFQRNKFNIPVIAVTGSNGKTTAKEMIARVLSKKFKVLKNEGTKNNQIGLPLALLKLNRDYGIAVLELGTNHFGEIDYLAKVCLPDIGIIINIGPAHLEFLHNLGGVLREKYTLIDNLKKPYIGILNADDILLRKKMSKNCERPIILGFGIKNQSDFFASNIENKDGKIYFWVNEKYQFTLRTLGYYNIYNALAAIAIGRLFGIEYRDIVTALANFSFPQGRLNLRELKNIRFIDDSYNSNPISLKQALNALNNFKVRGRKIFIMGDMLELGKRAELFHYQAGCAAAKICDAFITVGKLSKLAAKGARSCGLARKDIFSCQTSREARNILFDKVSPCGDDIVLVKGSRLMRMEEVFK